MNKFVENTILNFRKRLGVLTTEQNYLERLKICGSCPYKGKVQPLPTMELDGCTLCGCPFETKAKMKKDFSTEKGFYIITCPHPDGNKWEEVDKKFSNL